MACHKSPKPETKHNEVPFEEHLILLDEEGVGTVILWEPRADARETTAMGQLLSAVEEATGLHFDGYNDFWEWSVSNIEAFWSTLVDHLGVRFRHRGSTVLTSHSIRDARWFPESTLNYAEHALQGPAEQVVIESHSQTRAPCELTRGELRDQVARVQTCLTELGVESGDRVAAYLPNISEAVVILLASASLGAVFVSCAPEFGIDSAIARLSQVHPKVLFVVDGYRFGSKEVDRSEDIAAIRDALPSLQATIAVPYLSEEKAAAVPNAHSWSWILEADGDKRIHELPFDHPLYILFSSGSTGPPKPIVHSHGGITIEHLKWLAIHTDVTSSSVVFWPSTTAWMTWNIGVSTLLCGARAIQFDGDPLAPSIGDFWRFVADRQITHLGVSPPLLNESRKAGIHPKAIGDLSRLRVVSAGGSPVSEQQFRWVYEEVGSDLMLASVSGGTDCCTAFVGGSPLSPVWAGEITCRFLGTKVEAFDEDGTAVTGRQAELVVTEPMPSMPLRFWGDDDGSRMRTSYFEKFPGVWCHGDWITITERGTAIITGRSDATLNRGGVRMGTQEFYAAMETIPSVADSMVVHLEDPEGGLGELIMFVSLPQGVVLDSDLLETIRSTLQSRLSPRSVPNQIIVVPVIPRTITGKRLEVPVKRMLNGYEVGHDVTTVLADPNALGPFRQLAATRHATNATTEMESNVPM